VSQINKEYYQQQYLASMVRTKRIFQENVERWNKPKDEQAKAIMLEHARRNNLPINPEVMDGTNKLLQ